MKYILAISGGVDSVVLLDRWAKTYVADELMVAHVDHGIRDDSAADARFVQGLSAQYGVGYVSKRFNLGSNASEDEARVARYDFLLEMAGKFDAEIVTAHHADDMVGSIAINLLRGTGWRGLSVLDRPGLVRPLLGLRKRDIYAYALEHQLEWVEDYTNNDLTILRNRLRTPLVHLDNQTVRDVAALRTRQIELKHQISDETRRLLDQFGTKRYPYMTVDYHIASELLREVVAQTTSVRPTYIDAEKMTLAIKTARSGTELQLSDGVRVRFGAAEFVVECSSRW